MANTISTKQPVWTNNVTVELTAPSGSVAGETNGIVIPGGSWKITNVWGVKEQDSPETLCIIDVGISGTDYTPSLMVASGTILDGQMLPYFSGTVAEIASGANFLSGSSSLLRVTGDDQLAVRSRVVGGTGNGGANLFITLTAVNPE